MTRKEKVTNFVEQICNTELETLNLCELVALKLTYIYLASGLSQLEFSIRTDLNMRFFNDLIRCKHTMTINKLGIICKNLNIEILEFFNFKPLYLIKEQKAFVIVSPYDNLRLK